MFQRITSFGLIVGAAVIVFGAVAQANTLKFDFGENILQTAGNYNNLYHEAGGGADNNESIANAIDTTGASTGITLTVAGANSGVNTSGTQTPSGAAAIFDSQATRDNFYGNTGLFNNTTNPVITLTLTGLDASGLTSYDFTFFGARFTVTDNREAQYSVLGLNGGAGFLDAGNNSTNVATVAGIVPTALGEITVNVSPGPNNNNSLGFYYLGAMQMSSVPEPASLSLLGLGGLLLTARRR